MIRIPIGFLWISALVVASQGLLGATIVRLSEEQHAVLLNAGETEGFSTGKSVCFFDKPEQQILCGKIVKSTKNHAYVRVKREEIVSLRKGLSAQLQPDPPHKWELTGAYTPWIATPFTVTVPNYLPPAKEATQTNTLWKANKKLSSSFTSGALELLLPMIHVRAGLRYLQFPTVSTVQSNYDPANTSSYVERSFSGSALGLFGAYDLIRKGRFSLGAGLDVNQSTATMKAQAKNDTKTLDKTIFSIKSVLTVVSLYIPVRYNLPLFDSSFTLGLGGDFLLPLFAMGTPQVTEADSVNGSKVPDAIADAQGVLAHKKNSFGLAIVVGLTYWR